MKMLQVLSGIKSQIVAGVIANMIVLVASNSFASWTPLISSGWNSGIVTDLGTAAAGILACCAIILGIGLLVRAIGR